MSKRAREFAASMEAPLKTPHTEFNYGEALLLIWATWLLSEKGVSMHAVNPFELMMAASRSQSQQQRTGGQSTSRGNESYAHATHAMQAQQQLLQRLRRLQRTHLHSRMPLYRAHIAGEQ